MKNWYETNKMVKKVETGKGFGGSLNGKGYTYTKEWQIIPYSKINEDLNMTQDMLIGYAQFIPFNKLISFSISNESTRQYPSSGYYSKWRGSDYFVCDINAMVKSYTYSRQVEDTTNPTRYYFDRGGKIDKAINTENKVLSTDIMTASVGVKIDFKSLAGYRVLKDAVFNVICNGTTIASMRINQAFIDKLMQSGSQSHIYYDRTFTYSAPNKLEIKYTGNTGLCEYRLGGTQSIMSLVSVYEGYNCVNFKQQDVDIPISYMSIKS